MGSDWAHPTVHRNRREASCIGSLPVDASKLRHRKTIDRVSTVKKQQLAAPTGREWRPCALAFTHGKPREPADSLARHIKGNDLIVLNEHQAPSIVRNLGIAPCDRIREVNGSDWVALGRVNMPMRPHRSDVLRDGDMRSMGALPCVAMILVFHQTIFAELPSPPDCRVC